MIESLAWIKLFVNEKLPVYQFYKRLQFVVIYLFLLTGSGKVLSQTNPQPRVDSLKSVLAKSSEAQKFEILYVLAYELFDVDNQEALVYATEAFEKSYETGDSLKIVKGGRLKAQILRRVSLLDESISTLRRILPIAERNNITTELKYILNGLAICYTFKANYDSALDYNLRSLIIREREGNKAEISVTLNNIGAVYFKLKNYEKAREYFQRSLNLKREAKDMYDLDRTLINIGMCHIQLHQYDKALEFINEGLFFCKEACKSDVFIEGKFGLGIVYINKKDTIQAEKFFSQSLQLSKKEGNKRFIVENLVYLGRIQTGRGQAAEAKLTLTQAEVLADSAGYNQLLMDTYRQFSVLYSKNRDFEFASFYKDKYIKLKDSLIGEELVTNVAKVQTKFEERVNIATIAQKEEDLVRQRNLNIAIGVIAVLAGLLVFVLYRSNSITRRVNSALSDAKGIIETQNHRLQNINRELDAKVKEKTADLLKANEDLDKANKSLVRVNDELDNFIYKTSHDIRGPLASLKGICSVALMDVKDPLALDYLTKLDVSSGRLNVILTRLLIVNQINHAIVGREPIDFNNIIDDVLLLERKKGLPLRLEINKDVEKNINFLSDKDLVRIILENLIDNSIKFYNDSERVQPFVNIKIAVQNDKDVVVSVIDNGIGIAEAKPDKIFQMFSRASERSGTGGIGLYLSKLATEKLGGQINLRSTPEGHTEFYVSFPLKMQLV